MRLVAGVGRHSATARISGAIPASSGPLWSSSRCIQGGLEEVTKCGSGWLRARGLSLFALPAFGCRSGIGYCVERETCLCQDAESRQNVWVALNQFCSWHRSARRERERDNGFRSDSRWAVHSARTFLVQMKRVWRQIPQRACTDQVLHAALTSMIRSQNVSATVFMHAISSTREVAIKGYRPAGCSQGVHTHPSQVTAWPGSEATALYSVGGHGCTRFAVPT